jgi:hypothetical protein
MWIDPRDLKAQGDPETVVLLPDGNSLVGLYIRGFKTKFMLGISEDREGQPLSCAVTNEVYIDTSHMQSNPVRKQYRDDITGGQYLNGDQA